MAVQNSNSNIQYAGNGSNSVAYPIPFYFFTNADIRVFLLNANGVESELVLNTGFSVTGAGNQNGGNMTTAIAYNSAFTITIVRDVTPTQTLIYDENDKFPAKSHERGLDKLTMIVQQVLRQVGRSIRFTESYQGSAAFAPSPNTVLGIAGSGSPRTYNQSELLTYLNLTIPGIIGQPTVTFADAGERALAIPAFLGQIGGQRDTKNIYMSTGTTAGDWVLVEENMSLADFAAGFFTADATGRGKFASGFVDSGLLDDDAVITAKIDDDAVTTAKIDDDAVTTAKILDASITPAKLSQPYTLATSVASTSGTSIDFTGIPSWVKRITVMFADVSTDGTSTPLIQLGDVGGIETTGYVSTGMQVSNNSASSGNSTDGFVIRSILAANAISGIYVFALIDGATNSWSGSGTFKASTIISSLSNGNKSLSDPLTQIRITTANGTDTFDAGSINISYEG
jgi:hypothetical protein